MTLEDLLWEAAHFDQLMKSYSSGREKIMAVLSAEPDPTAGYVRLRELDARFIREMERLKENKRLVSEAIDSLSKPLMKRIIQYRYFDEMKWDAIVRTLRLDRRWVFRQHSKAMDELEDMLVEEYEEEEEEAPPAT